MVIKDIKKKFARELRKYQTLSEEKVWEILRNRRFLEFKFRRQHVIEGFVIDFFCKELKLGIEVDGGVHLNRKEYDDIRQMIIESEGIRIIRILNDEIRQDPNKVLNGIKREIENSSVPVPLSRGQRERG